MQYKNSEDVWAEIAGSGEVGAQAPTPAQPAELARAEPVVDHIEPASSPPFRLPAFPTESSTNVLARFSLKGELEQLEKAIREGVFVLPLLALVGQATVIYGSPNVGKTATVIALLIRSIVEGRINPAHVFYVNVDDTTKGVVEKLNFAEEIGFHMLVDGFKDFSVDKFPELIRQLIANGDAQHSIVILDTLKRFTDLMDKKASSGFTKLVRQFIVKGGTIIALAHTNKKKDANGKGIYSGTSDIVDDFDCAFILDEVVRDEGTLRKIIEFTNIKRRGDVAMSLGMSYALEAGLSYAELIASFEIVDTATLEPLKQSAELASDGAIISVITACLHDGINTKMLLAEEAASRLPVPKRQIMRIIEKYTGDDPTTHLWRFTVRARGAKVFELLEASTHPDHHASAAIG